MSNTLQLEVGKTYLDRTGRHIKIIDFYDFSISFEGQNHLLYERDGKLQGFWSEKDEDLISEVEVITHPEPFTLGDLSSGQTLFPPIPSTQEVNERFDRIEELLKSIVEVKKEEPTKSRETPTQLNFVELANMLSGVLKSGLLTKVDLHAAVELAHKYYKNSLEG